MKKYMKKGLAICLTIIMALSMTITGFAQTYQMTDGTEVKEFSTNNSVGIYASPRSALISSVSLELTKESTRKLKLHSEIICHVEMKEIYMSVSLQKQNGSNWKNVTTEDFEWLKKDYPNTILSMAIASYTVGSLEDGNYRIKSTFSVYEKDGTRHESKTSTSPSMSIP